MLTTIAKIFGMRVVWRHSAFAGAEKIRRSGNHYGAWTFSGTEDILKNLLLRASFTNQTHDTTSAGNGHHPSSTLFLNADPGNVPYAARVRRSGH